LLVGLHRVDASRVMPSAVLPSGVASTQIRIPCDLKGQGVHAVRHGGREEHGLALPRATAAGSVFDLGSEAHVQHPVRLVEDERPSRSPSLVDIPPLDM
jgi:hypothetical protein